jgi:hypothetical protein
MMKNKRRSSRFPIALIALGFLLIIAAGVWYLRTSSTPQVEAEIPNSEIDVPRVSVADAKAAYDTGTAVFLDVRDAGSYTRSHIAGAISIPLGELPTRVDELDASSWIITYCT